MPYTSGFRTRERLENHFDFHGDEFGAADEEDYERMADTFAGGPSAETTLECVRVLDGAVVRWDRVTQEFAIVSADGFIQTYFKPDPRDHGLSSNRAYFDRECRRR